MQGWQPNNLLQALQLQMLQGGGLGLPQLQGQQQQLANLGNLLPAVMGGAGAPGGSGALAQGAQQQLQEPPAEARGRWRGRGGQRRRQRPDGRRPKPIGCASSSNKLLCLLPAGQHKPYISGRCQLGCKCVRTPMHGCADDNTNELVGNDSVPHTRYLS